MKIDEMTEKYLQAEPIIHTSGYLYHYHDRICLDCGYVDENMTSELVKEVQTGFGYGATFNGFQVCPKCNSKNNKRVEDEKEILV